MKLHLTKLVLCMVTLCSVVMSSNAAENENIIWIDVRTVQEYRRGHIEGAINIPHGEISYKLAALVPDPYTEIHLYCATGTFAGMALEILMEMGYQAVVNEGAYEKIVARQKAD